MDQSKVNHNPKEAWHLSKSVPISIILGLFLQTAGAIWWASGMSKDVENIKADVSKTVSKTDVEMKLALRDERISNINIMLERIDNKLDKLVDR